ncbi:MAG: MBL fold metallo-hydrolase [Anaerolineae bacterium]|nr:MBL fold metallo-hydrolase [Anaerolineae bacterium]
MVTPARARWLGAAGFDLQWASARVLVDPFLVEGARSPLLHELAGERWGIDAVLVTHGHIDHARDVPTIALRTGAPVYASTSVCELLHDLGAPARQLHPLAGGRVAQLGAVTVLAVPARHVRFDLATIWAAVRRIRGRLVRCIRELAAYPCGDVLGYRLSAPEGSVVHFGSAGWYRSDLTGLQPDVALLPLQGHRRIYERVAQAAEWLGARRLVVHHHDDFYPPLSTAVDVGPFVRWMRDRLPEVEVIAPQRGRWMPLYGRAGA